MIFKGLVISVGMTKEPVLKAINARNPENILFVVSKETRNVVTDEILPVLNVSYIPQFEYLEVEDPEHMGECYERIEADINRWMAECRLSAESVYVDITGGTKVMSAALTLSAVERFNAFTYVGGRERVDGRVVTGTEEVIPTQNPWNKYAVREIERANWLMRDFLFDAAAATLRTAEDKCADDGIDGVKERLKAYVHLAEAFGRADRFDFSGAEDRFNRCRTVMRLTLKDQAGALEFHYNRWRALKTEIRSDGKTPGRDTLLELLANAERRAKQSRYDDAVARLYRAVELFGQQLVREAFGPGAEMGVVKKAELSVDLQRNASILSDPSGSLFRYNENEGTYVLAARSLYRFLEASNDSRIIGYSRLYDEIGTHMRRRNTSILAHGVRPISGREFNQFWQAFLSKLNIGEESIPRWPTIDLKLQ